MANRSASARFRSLFEAGLQVYEKKTSITLAAHPLAIQIQSCHSVESISAVLQGQARAFTKFQGSDKMIKLIKNTLSILTALSDTATLGDSSGLPFSPARAIHAGLAILFNAANGVTDSYDALVDLLESIEHFLNRLDIYTRIPATPTMDEIVVKIIVEVLTTLALATKELKQGRSIKFVRKIFGEKEVEAALQRLDRLTQDEARTTAAETLKVVHSLVQGMREVMDDGKASLEGVREDLKILHQIASDMNQLKRDNLYQDICRWLIPPDPWKNYHIARGSRQSGTGVWFVQGDTLSKWKASRPSALLWVHGKPGAGKSVLCSTIIEEIETMQKSGLASLTMYFCDFRDDQKKDLRGLLSSVLVQLCRQSDLYYEILSKFYSEHACGSQYASDDALVRCLKDMAVLPEQAPIFLIVDGLDECPNTSALSSHRQKVLMLLKDLIDSQLPNLRVCITSRPEADIKTVLEPLCFLSVSLHDEPGQIEDIKNYIKSIVYTNPCMQRWKSEHKQLVVDVLTERADGMFRWVYCQLDYLGKCLPGRIRHALDQLPATLDETYERTLREISDTNCEFAVRLLVCVAVAFRPLLVEELADFLAFDFTAGPVPEFHEDWRMEDPLDAVLSTCSTLLAVVKADKYRNTRVVQFSHFSVKEYLTSTRFAEKHDAISHCFHFTLTPAHTLVAGACLGILLQLDKSTTRDSLWKLPLTQYAAEYWFMHARFEGVSRSVEEGMKRLFDASKPHLAVWVWVYDLLHPWDQNKTFTPWARPQGTALHYAAFCGLHHFVRLLVIEYSEDVHARDVRNKSTPLHLASREGHAEVARFLIDRGADMTAQDKRKSTPLHLASERGHMEIVQFLVERGANMTVRDKHRATPLHLALGWHHTELAQFLIEHGADTTARNNDGLTPLHQVSAGGHVKLAQLLIERGADMTAQDKDGMTPLHRALIPGHMGIAQLLVERGADATARTKDGSTVLHWALGLPMVTLEFTLSLVEHGADVTAQDKDGSTPLHQTSRWGHIEIARFLVESGADVTSQDKDGSTALHQASIYGHMEITRFLIESGADVTAQDKDGSTALHLALRSPLINMAFAQLLVEHGADVTTQEKDGSTPLHRASSYGLFEVSQFLVKCGADVTAKSEDGLTPLHRVSENGHTELARFLVDRGADVTAQDKDGLTPLHQASKQGHIELARFLVERGAEVTAQDKDGSTSLHLVSASRSGNMELAQFLVERGADVTAQDEHGLTPLHLASRSDHTELARFLVEGGADVTARNEHGSTPLHWVSERGPIELAQLIFKHGGDITAQDKYGSTPLHLVSSWGNLEFAQFLIKHGADTAAQDKQGSTPLHVASEMGHMELARFLVEHGADTTAEKKDGSTPLHCVSVSPGGNSELAQFLIEHGADATAQGEDGLTPLHLASERGYMELAEILVEHGADPTAQKKDGATPLHCVSVSSGGNPELAQFLIEHGADATVQNEDGLTPLHVASEMGYMELTEILVEQGADATAQTKDGSTPLHLASLSGHTELAQFLVKCGADTIAQDKHGSTPLHFASERGHDELAQFLIQHQHGADGVTCTKTQIQQPNIT